MSISTIKKEEMCEDSLKVRYESLCHDLNMDMETRLDAWRSYEHICKHYYLEGDEIHWLSVSLYVSCRKSHSNNPISITRLLKSANDLKLLIFFDKLKKWIDMENLPDSLRKKIEDIQYSFNISSIIFQKYFQLFLEIFHGNENKLNEFNYSEQRKSFQINPKLNYYSKQTKFTSIHLYQFIWINYSLIKTIYPSIANDLIASFHLLVSSIYFVYQIIQENHFDHLIKDSSIDLDGIAKKCHCSSEMLNVICEEYFHHGLFKEHQLIFTNEKQLIDLLNQFNQQYDEIILRNCLIDERIFFEKKSQLNDLLNSFNENRNDKSQQIQTPLSANEHLTRLTTNNPMLTPISQANQLITFLSQLIDEHPGKITETFIELIGQQTFLDLFNEKILIWKNQFHQQENLNQISISRFQFGLKLFYLTLEKILLIEKKRSQHNSQQLQSSFQKLIVNNEFLKSLLSLCLLIIFYAHSDTEHDLYWIMNLYELHGYSLLKIIQIFLKTFQEIQQSRLLIKYLSSLEEILISSMVFTKDSPLWNDIQSKGILSFQSISNFNEKTNLSSPFHQQFISSSPNSNQVKRKLFDQPSKNELTIIRSRSDPLIEKNQTKMSPYRMFYRKFYELVQRRLYLICLRLFGCQANSIEKIIWNLFVYLFENYTKILFQSRDLDQILLTIIFFAINSNLFNQQQQQTPLTWFRLFQAYKSIPNTKLKTLRCVFIRTLDQHETFQTNQNENNLPLTPSKPAGTIHLIDGNIFGDIASFYSEVFLKIENLQTNIEKYFHENSFLEFPLRKTNSFNSSEHFPIHCGENLFLNYSTNQFQQISFNLSDQNNQQSNQFNSTENVLSSSIQAGLNNRVQTTRIRTDDGKFLTTISTIPQANSNENHLKKNLREDNQFFFGQSTTFNHEQSFKRTFEQDSNSLTSLTKKVLLIQNHRQTSQQ